MKRFGFGLIVGVILASAVAYVICGLKTGALKLTYMSAVDTPVRIALDDIVATYDSGDLELAEAKTRLLQDRWNMYIAENNPPYGLGDVHVVVGDLKSNEVSKRDSTDLAHEKAE